MEHPIRVSFVRRCHETHTEPMTLEDVFFAIKNGGHGLKERITQIRNNYEYERDVAGHGTEAAKKAIASLKGELPGVLFSGTFSERNNAALVEYSGHLCADLDNLGPKLSETREALKDVPYVHAVMLSPSGDGLKVVFNVVPDPARHMDSFRAIQKLLRQIDLEIDEKCKDLARICFFTYDPDLWIRTEDNLPIDPLPPEPKRTPMPIADLGGRQQLAVEVFNCMFDWETETRGYGVCPGLHLHTSKNARRDFMVNVDGAPNASCVHTSCKGIVAGYNRLLQSKIEKVEGLLKPTRRAYEHDINEESRNTSFTSSLSKPHTSYSSCSSPPRLEKAAYYGLAGKIVDHIAPKSESDPAALLLQFLIAYGSLIGRHSHARVGGAYHHMNLFGVIVGETARGRKGTSWQDILHPVFGNQAPYQPWVDNITGGLSSGEGLIWCVRDDLTRTKRGELEVIEEGVTDKRLLIVEGEYARVLKVMNREFNTLSPVLRTAWESGTLRTLTKTPYRASGVHISMIGHITPEEVRKWMTQLEMANGFGNRFLWAAVERSQCLPEGGGIPDLSSLHEELLAATKHGAGCEPEELKRDDKAKDLWKDVYPALSGAEAGITGALKARAEAQVLRLSCIYTLLDCKTAIGVEHLEAALELWNFCSQSIDYIFKKGTGNADADKILAALLAAGKTGMTRWDIQNDVFNRNATKHQVDEALRLLLDLSFARFTEEETGGRKAHRWFAGTVNEETKK